MVTPQLLGTARIGQLTGSTSTNPLPPDPPWPDPIDAQHWPLLNDTGIWGVNGVDLGANTEHDDGRLYFFFGDVAIDHNPDFIAWTDDRSVLHHGGHLAIGWNFFIPNDHQGAGDTTGQRRWRFCLKCGGMFWSPDNVPAGVCPKNGAHEFHPESFEFFLPNDQQGATDATGQKDWRFCRKCRGLFWARNGDPAGSVCPNPEGGPTHDPIGWNFHLPNDHQGAGPATGQRWRFCTWCHGLFWNDDGFKGLCPGAPGGGVHLRPLLRQVTDAPATFAHFTVASPIGELGPNETPTGTFSYGGKVYVFVWVGTNRDQLHIAGSYLVSNPDPAHRSVFDIEFPVFSKLHGNPVGFWQVCPVVVNNADHPGLPAREDTTGLVMFGHGYNANVNGDAIHLAWMPLRPGVGPARRDIRYFAGPVVGWTDDPSRAAALPFNLESHYTSVSAAWIPQVRRWIVIYSEAIDAGNDFAKYRRPIVARISEDLVAWSDRTVIFDPAGAYGPGGFMHWPGSGDIIQSHIPPLPPFEPGTTVRQDRPGWPYGAFLLNRFTEWDQPARVLTIRYLLSTSRPYQVQMMETRLHI